MAKEKPHLNVVFVGHVDHGKSTTVGRLMFDAGVIPEQDMRKLKELAQQVGKAGFEFAFVMDNLKDEIGNLIKSVGYKPENVQFIPTASFLGDNIVKKSENMAWYTGPTLLEQIDKFPAPEKPTQLPLRLPIQDVYSITGICVVPVGRVETGVMKINDKIVIMPGREGTGVKGDVKTIEMHHEQIQQAEPGDNVGFSVRGINKKDIARGDVLGREDSPPTVVSEFTAQIVVINHPSVLTVGYTPVFHIHTAQVACQITQLLKKLNPATGEVLQENPDMLKNGDAAIVVIKPTKPLVIEKVKEIPQMSRFAIRDAGQTVAAGMCLESVKK